MLTSVKLLIDKQKREHWLIRYVRNPWSETSRHLNGKAVAPRYYVFSASENLHQVSFRSVLVFLSTGRLSTDSNNSAGTIAIPSKNGHNTSPSRISIVGLGVSRRLVATKPLHAQAPATGPNASIWALFSSRREGTGFQTSCFLPRALRGN